MEDLIFVILGVLLIVFVFFLILRELNNWYWKINERVYLHNRTNVLLEKIFIQLGGTDSDVVKVKNTVDGIVKVVPISKWLLFKEQNPQKAKDYIILNNDDSTPSNENTEF